MLAPIFDEAADKVTSEFPSSRVILGKVDCDKESMKITTSCAFNYVMIYFPIVFGSYSFYWHQIPYFQIPNT